MPTAEDRQQVILRMRPERTWETGGRYKGQKRVD